MADSSSSRLVIYHVEFPIPDNPPSYFQNVYTMVVQIAKGGTALDVMTAAADKDKKFNFTTTYKSNEGYHIDNIIGEDNTPRAGFWVFYYRNPTMSEIKKSSLKVSSLLIPGNDWEIVMKYEKASPLGEPKSTTASPANKGTVQVPMGGHGVGYQVEFSDNSGQTIKESTVVRIANGGTALDVMTAAADQDEKFNFQATYYGNSGYFTDAIGNIPASKGSSYWAFSYYNPKTKEVTSSSFGVSSVVIPGNGWRVIMKYTCKLKNFGCFLLAQYVHDN